MNSEANLRTEITVKGETRIARPLEVLIPLIKDKIKSGLEDYRAAGEMLLEAKSHLAPRQFQGWFDKQNFGWSVRSASRYMALAEIRASESNDSGWLSKQAPRRLVEVPETLESTIGETRSPRIAEPSYHRPVIRELKAVDTKALALEEQGKRKERELVRQLGMQLVKIGYRILAEKLHPDKSGGSTEAMSRLNKVREILEGALK